MSVTLDTLEPKLIWKIFTGVSAVPRPSKHEEKIRTHLRGVAEEHGLKYTEDRAGNLVITVPATAGHEDAAITVLQAHVDMVCEKNSDTEHDFDNEGIHLMLDTDANGETIVRARGTTLGADNGIGVAMAFAAALDESVVHGPLEILLTTDEEAGMTGAKALTPESFRGRRLLNLDSEEDDALYIGCAGGCDTNLNWSLAPQPARSSADTDSEAVSVTVSGLRGGHSGGDIHENRANAIKLLAQVLLESGVDGLRLGAASGGSKRNAIPREAHAIVHGPAGMTGALTVAAESVVAHAKTDSHEPGAMISVQPAESSAHALAAADTSSVLAAIAALPQGVLGMSPAVPGLVQTSNNVSTMSVAPDGTVEIGCLSRSSSAYWNSVTLAQIAAIGRLAGAAVQNDNEYPGWEPNVDSRVLASVRRVYERLFGETPGVAAIHAGLECGIIGRCVGEIDMVSFGPRIEGAHSPDERVYPASVEKSWSLLKAVLEDLAKA